MELQFGLAVSPSAQPGADPVRDGVLAESLGFDFVSVSDHPCGVAPNYEAWTMLSWIAAATSRIRIATRVLGVPYRSPALVAKMAETFHRLSGGRLILGLGGGYSDDEFRAFGLRVPSPGEKVRGLVEAIDIIRGLWSEPDFSYEGRLHHTERANIAPRPESPIPIWLGTFGDQALTVTGRLADGWIPSHGFAPPEQAAAMRARVRRAAVLAGRDPNAVTCAYHLEVHVGEPASTEPGVIAGSAAEVAKRLTGFVELGFTTLSFALNGPDPADQARRLAHDVLPAVRAGVAGETSPTF
ncbi:LLM class flavin-dependent oxidoreductase [Jiangella alba]|uniref:Luciferase-like monooxygenase n=2 Tax=Jiangella alba TaxID=561176 RepID=A0A1H5PKN3_9ACTN|nr:LLM class flavin-dependent oxidoreductase [Jiangella alba]SEF13577.1 Luciferase-like monooxygenase [Jiangella alba]